MFRGINAVNIDAKGRLAIPTRLRQELHLPTPAEQLANILVDVASASEVTSSPSLALSIDDKGEDVQDFDTQRADPDTLKPELLQVQRSPVVVTIDTEERCLLLYPFVQWQEIEAKIVALPSFNRQARRIQRLLIGHAHELEVDAQGRILLPTLLREYANLDKQVILVGQGKKIELWDSVAWQQERESWLGVAQQLDEASLPDQLKDLSL